MFLGKNESQIKICGIALSYYIHRLISLTVEKYSKHSKQYFIMFFDFGDVLMVCCINIKVNVVFSRCIHGD